MSEVCWLASAFAYILWAGYAYLLMLIPHTHARTHPPTPLVVGIMWDSFELQYRLQLRNRLWVSISQGAILFCIDIFIFYIQFSAFIKSALTLSSSMTLCNPIHIVPLAFCLRACVCVHIFWIVVYLFSYISIYWKCLWLTLLPHHCSLRVCMCQPLSLSLSSDSVSNFQSEDLLTIARQGRATFFLRRHVLQTCARPLCHCQNN